MPNPSPEAYHCFMAFSTKGQDGIGIEKRRPSMIWGLLRSTANTAAIPHIPPWVQGDVNGFDWTADGLRREHNMPKPNPAFCEFTSIVCPSRLVSGSLSCFAFAARHQNSPIAEHVRAVAHGISTLPPGTAPWQHIFPQNDCSVPVPALGGVYAVKLFWMGAWRMVLVDVHINFDEQLFPESTDRTTEFQALVAHLVSSTSSFNSSSGGREGWPEILTRAVLKLLSARMRSGFQARNVFEDVSFVHLFTGLSPEDVHVSVESDNWKIEEQLWNKMLAEMDHRSNPHHQCVYASYRAVVNDGCGASDNSSGHKQYSTACKEAGLDPGISHTARVACVKEVSHSALGKIRMVYLESACIVWRGKFSWDDSEVWPLELQRVMAVNRISKLVALRRALSLQVAGKDHDLFSICIEFADFLRLFNVLRFYSNTLELKHQAVNQRGEDEECVEGKRSNRRKPSNRPKSSTKIRPGTKVAPSSPNLNMPSTVTLMTECSRPSTVFVTFSAYGSNEKFLDGTSLKVGKLSAKPVEPFERVAKTYALSMKTSFVTMRAIEVPVGRHVLEFHFEGSRRTSIAVSSATAACTFDNAAICKVRRQESKFLTADSRSFTSALTDIIENLNFKLVPQDLMRRIMMNPLCYNTNALECIETFLDHLHIAVSREIQDCIKKRISLSSIVEIEVATNASDEDLHTQVEAHGEADELLSSSAPPKIIMTDCTDLELSISAPLCDHTDDITASLVETEIQRRRRLRQTVLDEKMCAWDSFMLFLRKAFQEHIQIVQARRPRYSKDEAAQVIQRSYRKYRGRADHFLQVVRKNTASRTIQRYYRGYIARKRVQIMKEDEGEMRRLLRLFKASESRLYDVRSVLKDQKKRRGPSRLNPRDKNVISAIIKIQACVRCVLIRRKFLRKKNEITLAKVARVQQLWDDIGTSVQNSLVIGIWRSLLMTSTNVAYRYIGDVVQTCTAYAARGELHCEYPTGTTVLFRECFTLDSTKLVMPVLHVYNTSKSVKCRGRVRIVNLDTGEDCNSCLLAPAPIILRVNNKGYCIIGEIVVELLTQAMTGPVSGTWHLCVTTDTTCPFPPEAAFGKTQFMDSYLCGSCTDFSVKHPMFRVKLFWQANAMISLYFQTDQPNLPVKLVLSDDKFNEVSTFFTQDGVLQLGTVTGVEITEDSDRENRMYFLDAFLEDYDVAKMLPEVLKCGRVFDPNIKAKAKSKSCRLSVQKSASPPGKGRRLSRGGCITNDGLNWGLRVIFDADSIVKMEECTEFNHHKATQLRRKQILSTFDDATRACSMEWSTRAHPDYRSAQATLPLQSYHRLFRQGIEHEVRRRQHIRMLDAAKKIKSACDVSIAARCAALQGRLEKIKRLKGNIASNLKSRRSFNHKSVR